MFRTALLTGLLFIGLNCLSMAVKAAPVDSVIAELQLADDNLYVDLANSMKVIEKYSQKSDSLTPPQLSRLTTVKLRALLITGQMDKAALFINSVKPSVLEQADLLMFHYLVIRYGQAVEDFVLSFQHLNYALKLNDDSLSIALRLKILLAATDLNIDAGTYRNAEKWLNQAIKLVEHSSDISLKCSLNHTQIYFLAKQELYDKVAQIVDEAIDICTQSNEPVSLSMFHVSRSFMFAKRGEYSTQQQILEFVLKEYGELNGQFNVHHNKLLLAESFINQDLIVEAQDLLASILPDIKASRSESNLATVYRLTSAIYEKNGDISSAVSSYNSFIDYQSRYDTAVNENQLIYLNAQLASSDTDLDELLQQLIAQNRSEKKNLSLLNTVIGLTCAAMVLILIGFATRYVKNHRKVQIIESRNLDALTRLLSRAAGQQKLVNRYLADNYPNQQILLGYLRIRELNTIIQSYSFDHGDRLIAKVAHRLKALKHSDLDIFIDESANFVVSCIAPLDSDINLLFNDMQDAVSSISLSGVENSDYHFDIAYGVYQTDSTLTSIATLAQQLDDLKLSLSN